MNDVASHPSSRVALSVGRDRSLRLIDLTKGKVIAVQSMGTREPKEVRYSPDGAKFAVLFDSGVVIHNATSAEPMFRVELPESVVKFVSFAFVGLPGVRAAERYCLAVGCEGGALLLVDQDGRLLAMVSTGHTGRVRCIAAASSSDLLFTVGADAVVFMWSVASIVEACAAKTVPTPLQRLTNAAGFRGTCLTLVESVSDVRTSLLEDSGAGVPSSNVASKKLSKKHNANANATIVLPKAPIQSATIIQAPADVGEKRKRKVAFATSS